MRRAMTAKDIEIYEQDMAVLKKVNAHLHTTFRLQQLCGANFSKMRLSNKSGTILCAPLDVMDKICIGMLAIVDEVDSYENTKR